jgi:hypothetical protein
VVRGIVVRVDFAGNSIFQIDEKDDKWLSIFEFKTGFKYTKYESKDVSKLV